MIVGMAWIMPSQFEVYIGIETLVDITNLVDIKDKYSHPHLSRAVFDKWSTGIGCGNRGCGDDQKNTRKQM
jgi:hypothetical protein